jgi:hypothetical protein
MHCIISQVFRNGQADRYCLYSEGRPGVFATTINILPGTHHIRFLVDNNMQTSPDLPTTVDFGNNLVNYIEVSPDDIPATQSEATKTPQERDDKQPTNTEEQKKARQPKDKQVLPVEAFSRVYPQYLLDYDNEPEDSPISQAAAAAIEKLPNPPSLPGFLSKPILNAATLMKDDNSVLNMPNHTTLNHLATSSIKNGTLAVSATTRYRDKVRCPLHCRNPYPVRGTDTRVVCDHHHI